MSSIQVRRWSRQEYDRLVEAGLLRPDEPVELIEGEIVEMPPQSSLHAAVVSLVEDALRAAFGPGHYIRVQLPLALGERSEPEPDVAVVAGTPRDFLDAHPSSALLVVEVADTTLAFDRDTKGGLYAKAGVAEYWLVDLVHRQVEVYREPGAVAGAPYGYSYRTRTIAVPGETIAPLASPGARIAVANLLP